MPLFSVIIPVYNSENTIEKCIKSVLDQHITDYEIIVVNDGSTDKSLEILERLAKEYKRIKVITQENSGPGIARNNGIANALGVYIAFLDADDYWEKDFFDEVLRVSENQSTDYIYIEMVKETADGKIIGRLNVNKNNGISKQQMLCRQMTGKMPWGMSKVVRRDVLLNSKGRFMGFSVGEENIFSFEALKASKKIAFTDKAIYHYVQNQNGQHKKGNFDPWNILVSNLKQYLIVNNEYETYKSTINSLALKALSISFYRYCTNLSFIQARKKMTQSYAYYSQNYDYNNLNIDSLDKSTITVFEFAKKKMFMVIFLASRFRNIKQN